MMHQFTPEQRWAVYARFSSDRQREASIDDQVRRCQSVLEAGGGKIREDLIFTDRAQSGGGTDRKGFEALMEAVRTQKVDGILTEDMSRLSRDFADSALLFRELQYLGVPLIAEGSPHLRRMKFASARNGAANGSCGCALSKV